MVKIIKLIGIVNSKNQMSQKKSSQRNNRERIVGKIVRIMPFEGISFLMILSSFP